MEDLQLQTFILLVAFFTVFLVNVMKYQGFKPPGCFRRKQVQEEEDV
jgi:hypothetical protein